MEVEDAPGGVEGGEEVDGYVEGELTEELWTGEELAVLPPPLPEGRKPSRLPSGILGCLIREHYPGLVKLPDGVFTPATGKENECCHVVGNLLRKLIPEMYYEARVRCVINWYAQVKRIPLPMSNARLRLMTREQYNLVPPQWCASKKACYAQIVDDWVSPAFVASHRDAQRRRRLLVGGVHRQGPLAFGAYVEKQAKWDEERRRAEEAERELAEVKATLQSHDERFASYDQLFADFIEDSQVDVDLHVLIAESRTP
ncbi:hypothetical protein ACQ4PT_032953 [Festuca glaucescens]